MSSLDATLAELSPRVLGALLRRYRDLSACEDALQEALLAASRQWPSSGLPLDPRAWLIAVANRRMHDEVRQRAARVAREEAVVSVVPVSEQQALAADEALREETDDSLEVFFACCHPALSSASAIALTLRLVGGLTTAQIAAAYGVPESTMAQRLSRARATVAEAGLPPLSTADQRPRLELVMRVLYLSFTEGYAPSFGAEPSDVVLTAEAIRVTRLLRAQRPGDGAVEALLALMLLTDARREARMSPEGALIPLEEQDRTRWDALAIAEGSALVTQAFARQGPLTRYHLQAAIAALHDVADSVQTTDWSQILELYQGWFELEPSGHVAMGEAVARAMVHGPAAGLQVLARWERDPAWAQAHRLLSVKGHLLERAGQFEAARQAFIAAARRTTNQAERDYLLLKAAPRER